MNKDIKELEILKSRIKQLEEFILGEAYCPKSYGYEGFETYSNCNKCVYCKLLKGE